MSYRDEPRKPRNFIIEGPMQEAFRKAQGLILVRETPAHVVELREPTEQEQQLEFARQELALEHKQGPDYFETEKQMNHIDQLNTRPSTQLVNTKRAIWDHLQHSSPQTAVQVGAALKTKGYNAGTVAVTISQMAREHFLNAELPIRQGGFVGKVGAVYSIKKNAQAPEAETLYIPKSNGWESRIGQAHKKPSPVLMKTPSQQIAESLVEPTSTKVAVAPAPKQAAQKLPKGKPVKQALPEATETEIAIGTVLTKEMQEKLAVSDANFKRAKVFLSAEDLMDKLSFNEVVEILRLAKSKLGM
jgi:hypothetical protein